MLEFPAEIVSTNDCVAWFEAASISLVVKGKVPERLVDPEITPVEASSCIPGGSVPEEMDHR